MKEHEILRLLMNNKFICSVSYPEAYRHLRDNKVAYERMVSQLQPFGVNLVTLSDGEVYAGLNNIPSDSDRKAVVKQFNEIYHDIAPIVEMIACLSTADEGNVLTVGESLSQTELVLEANNNKHFASMLNEVSEITGASKKPNDEKVAALLERLQKHEILKLVEPNKKIYRATGKIGYIYDVFDYIAENILDEPTEEIFAEQQGLKL